MKTNPPPIPPITPMPPIAPIPPPPAVPDAGQRLILAATRVFERDGLRGATTREIAREAGVNEVTLFRHFHSKDGLLAAAMAHKVAAHADLMQSTTAWVGDLAQDLRGYAQAFYRRLGESEAFIRMLVGEASRQPEYSRQLLIDASRPARETLVRRLAEAAAEGRMRRDVDPLIVADAFTDMLIFGMLRETAGWMPDYPADKYLETCLDLFIAGLTAKPETTPA